MIYYTIDGHPVKTNLPPIRSVLVLEINSELSYTDYLELSRLEYVRLCNIINGDVIINTIIK